MGSNNQKPDELMLVIMARMFKVKFCIACKNRRLWFSTKGGSLMDCDLYMGKVSFKKYALYSDANFEFKINGRILQSNSYLLRENTADSNMMTSDAGASQNDNFQVDGNTSTTQETVQSSQCAVVESQIAMSLKNSDNTQHIESCVGHVEERNVSGASSAIDNSDDLSSEDVNNIVIIQENPCAHSEDKNCDKSGDDISTIGASDPEQEILKTYSIAAKLIDAINEKEGNSAIMIPDNETDEGSAVADNVIEPNRDHEMFSDLEMDTVETFLRKEMQVPITVGVEIFWIM